MFFNFFLWSPPSWACKPTDTYVYIYVGLNYESLSIYYMVLAELRRNVYCFGCFWCFFGLWFCLGYFLIFFMIFCHFFFKFFFHFFFNFFFKFFLIFCQFFFQFFLSIFFHKRGYTNVFRKTLLFLAWNSGWQFQYWGEISEIYWTWKL